MRIDLKFLALSAIAFLGFQIAEAQDVTYSRYLPNTEVNSVTEDSHARMWVGTNYGFSIINNGYVRDFHQIVLPDGTKCVTSVFYIMPVAKEALIATPSSLYLFNIEQESFKEMEYDGSSLIVDSYVVNRDVAYFFVSNQNKLFKYSFPEGRLSAYVDFGSEVQYYFKNMVSVNGGKIYAFDVNQGAISIDTNDGSYAPLDLPRNILPISVSSDKANKLVWFACENDGIYCINADRNDVSICTHLSFKDDGLPDYPVTAISATSSCAIVATSGGGIYQLHKDQGLLTTSKAGVVNNLSSIIQCSQYSYVGGTSYNGLVRSDVSFFATLSSTSISNHYQLSSSTILCSMMDVDGRVWFGTSKSGINSYYPPTSNITYHNSPLMGSITSMAHYGEDAILMVSDQTNLLLFDKKSLQVRRFDDFPSLLINKDPLSEPNLIVGNCSDGSLLLLNSNGANYKLMPGVSHIRSFVVGTREEPETTLATLSFANHTLLRTSNSLYELNNSTLMVKRILNVEKGHISDISSDGGDLIYYTVDNELRCFSRSHSESVSFFNEEEPLKIQAMSLDRQNRLWMITTDNILLNVDIGTGERTFYPSIDCHNYSGRFSIVDQGGFIYLSSEDGVISIDTNIEYRYRNNSIPRLSLESIKIDGRTSPLDMGITNISIGSTVKSIEVSILVMNADPFNSNPVKKKLYRGSRLISEEINNEPVLTLGRISPGRYTFAVSVLTQSGWTDEETLLTFKVLAPAYASKSAIVLYLLLIAFAAALITMIVKRTRNAFIKETMVALDMKKNDEKISLMTNLAHDLRSPLSLVLNRVNSTISSHPDDEQINRTLKAALPQINRMGEMINMILSIQKETAKSEDEINLEELNLNQWMAARLTAEYKPKCESKGLTLRFEPDTRLQIISVDKSKLLPCCQNLMTNAIKYSERGTITVSTALVNNYFRISVSDEGCGFTGPATDLFKQFHRANTSVQGYGLGLAYVKSLVEKQGGTVGAFNNSPNAGSTFYFDIPLFNRESSATAVKRERNVQYDTTNDTILIVDDTKDIREFLSSEYKNYFKKVYTAEDGIKAIAVIKDKHPDIIISDLMMPNLDGFGLCKYVKTNVEVSHIPFILFSTKEDAIGQKISYKLGPDDVISKPFDMNLLWDIVRGQLKKRKEVKHLFLDGKVRSLTKEMLLSKADEDFVETVNVSLKDGNSIEVIAENLKMSVKAFNAKMLALTGQSARSYCDNFASGE